MNVLKQLMVALLYCHVSYIPFLEQNLGYFVINHSLGIIKYECSPSLLSDMLEERLVLVMHRYVNFVLLCFSATWSATSSLPLRNSCNDHVGCAQNV